LTERISRQQKHLDYLIADFAAIKAEIARRSTLQRVVLAGYFAVLALVFQQGASLTLSASWILALWAASALGFQFYAREGPEIDRLGDVIRTRIAPVAGEIIGAPPERLLPSETNREAQETPPQRRAYERRRAYDRSFNWAAFFAAPLLITLMHVAQCMREIQRLWDFGTPTPWVVLVVIVIGAHVVVLLWRHA